MKAFIGNYILSMRLYYCFVTCASVLCGIMAARSCRSMEGPFGARELGLLCIGFLAWGVNQIFSDYWDRREDAVNAPRRPMVTGELPAGKAMALSCAIMAVFAVASLAYTPWTLPALCAGGLLNMAYSMLKRVPVLDCLVYALSIACCALYGMVAEAGGLPEWPRAAGLLSYLVPVHFLMCHNSYYKDIRGDRAAGLCTLQVLAPKWVSMALGTVVFIALCLWPALHAGACMAALACHWAIAFALFAFLTVCLVRGDYHRATALNCQLCVALHIPPLLEGGSKWPIVVEALAVLAILLIFRTWYKDEKK